MYIEPLSRVDIDRGFEAIQKLSTFRNDLAKRGRIGMIGVIAALIANGENTNEELCDAVADIYGKAWDIQVNEIVDTYGNSEELPQLWERDSSGRLAPGGIWVVN